MSVAPIANAASAELSGSPSASVANSFKTEFSNLEKYAPENRIEDYFRHYLQSHFRVYLRNSIAWMSFGMRVSQEKAIGFGNHISLCPKFRYLEINSFSDRVLEEITVNTIGIQCDRTKFLQTLI